MSDRADHEALVRALIDSWEHGYESSIEGIKRYTAPDFEWWNSGWPDVRGHDAAIALWKGARDNHGLESFRTEIVGMIVDPPRVAVERIDHMLRADGSLIATIRIVGTFEIANGKIVSWHDYTDPSAMAYQGDAAP